MRNRVIMVLGLAVLVPAAKLAFVSAPVSDVPSGHWALASVKSITDIGVMTASGGKFDGGKIVTRVELTNTLARFGKSLVSGAWAKSTGSATHTIQPEATAWSESKVTRYELASLLDRVGRNVAQGLPKQAGKKTGDSEALPRVDVAKIPRSHPAYDSLVYLAKNRMIWPQSPLLKPGDGPVAAKEVVEAVAATLAGASDQLTDEPQNRQDLGEPPVHDRKK